MKTKIDLAIALEGNYMEVGQSMRIVCPACSDHERTCGITRSSEGILYMCHRSSCGVRGFVPTRADFTALAAPKVKELKPYYGHTMQLEDEDYKFLGDKYEMPRWWISGTIYRNEYEEYVLPIAGPSELIKGYNVRQPWAGSPRAGRPDRPKAKVWMHSHEPVQAFYERNYQENRDGHTLVMVEDQLSAIKVAYYGYRSVAIIGTEVNEAKIREIGLWRPKRVLIALDKDATNKAFGIARLWGLAFEKVRVILLEQDLKDTPLTDFPYVLGD